MNCEHSTIVHINYVGSGMKQCGLCSDCMTWVWVGNDQDSWKQMYPDCLSTHGAVSPDYGTPCPFCGKEIKKR